LSDKLTQIRRLKEPLKPGLLRNAFEYPVDLESEDIDLPPVDFGPFRDAIEKVRNQGGNTSGQRSSWDRDLAEPFHRVLADLSISDGLDMRLWHWLCIVEFPMLVRERWSIEGGATGHDIQPAGVPRFLGVPTLAGFARNCLARFWWAGETLYSKDDGYSLVSAVFAPQDLFTSVFERDLVLNRNTVRACVTELKGKDGKSVQVACKRLSQWATTLRLELLDESEIQHLLKEAA
jgi:hypothetical protein